MLHQFGQIEIVLVALLFVRAGFVRSGLGLPLLFVHDRPINCGCP